MASQIGKQWQLVLYDRFKKTKTVRLYSLRVEKEGKKKMFKILLTKWNEEQKKRELRKVKILNSKINELRYHLTQFFEDLQISKGEIDIPAWIECRNLMNKLNINLENPQIVNYYHKKLRKHKFKTV